MIIDNMQYLMEGEDETERLETKTSIELARNHLVWAGIQPGMKVLDLGCGTGIVSALMSELVGDKGCVVGVDGSMERIEYAEKRYLRHKNISFYQADLKDLPTLNVGSFDLIWSRFVFEYLKEPKDILSKCKDLLKKNGILCIIDLDGNGLNHYKMSPELESICSKLTNKIEKTGFDFFVGRKLYKMFYDQNLADIEVGVEGYHCIYGPLDKVDRFNWLKKIETLSKYVPDVDPYYPGGPEGFVSDFMAFFEAEDRFTYTPLIKVKGRK